MRKYDPKKIVSKMILYIVIVFGGFILISPFLWMLSTALKTNTQTFAFPPRWIPSPIQWQNFIEAWTKYAPFNLFLKNTFIITVFSLIGTVLSASIVAFSFARLEWPGRNVLFMILLSTMMIPFYVTMVPIFIFFGKLGWINTFKPLIIPYWFGGSAFNIFLLRQFFMTIPRELDDAARIDGCSTFGIYWRIMLPLSKPGLTTVVIFTFIWRWNDFIQPLIYLNDYSKFTLSLGLLIFRTEFVVYWNFLMAASILVMLPCLFVFFFAQKYFIRGIALTGIKR